MLGDVELEAADGVDFDIDRLLNLDEHRSPKRNDSDSSSAKSSTVEQRPEEDCRKRSSDSKESLSGRQQLLDDAHADSTVVNAVGVDVDKRLANISTAASLSQEAVEELSESESNSSSSSSTSTDGDEQVVVRPPPKVPPLRCSHSQSAERGRIERQLAMKKQQTSTSFGRRFRSPETVEMAYKKWLADKEGVRRQKKKATESQQKKKQEEKFERSEAAKKTFESWKAERDNKIQQRKRLERQRKQELLQKEKEEEEGKLEKQNTAKKVFEGWKANRDEEFRNWLKSQRQPSRQQQRKEVKHHETDDVFKKWKEKRDVELASAISKERLKTRNVNERRCSEQLERSESASIVYFNWLQQKEQDRLQQMDCEIRGSRVSLATKPPWIPPNNVMLPSKNKSRRLNN